MVWIWKQEKEWHDEYANLLFFFTDCGIGEAGGILLCEAMMANKTVASLNLSGETITNSEII